MRPTVSESLAGVRRILDEVVGPEVRGEYARTNLARCLATLEEVEARWHQVSPHLRVEIDDLTGVLAAVADDPSLDAGVRERVAGALAKDPLGGDGVAPYQALLDRYTELRGLAVAVVDGVDRGGPPSPAVDAMRAYLRRAVDRGLGL